MQEQTSPLKWVWCNADGKESGKDRKTVGTLTFGFFLKKMSHLQPSCEEGNRAYLISWGAEFLKVRYFQLCLNTTLHCQTKY